MTRRALPIGIQTLREIREGDFYYVDKTALALRLIAEGKYYFLSRPRRFGKSLFLDTLAELFEGNAALCGYTEADLDRVFAPELEGLDREQIRAWYNGYNWLGEAVYNPFDLLLLFKKRLFQPW